MKTKSLLSRLEKKGFSPKEIDEPALKKDGQKVYRCWGLGKHYIQFIAIEATSEISKDYNQIRLFAEISPNWTKWCGCEKTIIGAIEWLSRKE